MQSRGRAVVKSKSSRLAETTQILYSEILTYKPLTNNALKKKTSVKKVFTK